MTSARSILVGAAFAAALLAGPDTALTPPTPLLSGHIKSADGKAMGGVMVSAKPEGGTITTTVLTDEAGPLLFPAACRRKISRLGASAVVCDSEGRDRARRGADSTTSRSSRWRTFSGSCPATSCCRRCLRTTTRTSA